MDSMLNVGIYFKLNVVLTSTKFPVKYGMLFRQYFKTG